ncbi:hypothetical protein EON65_43085 [archaeon]|nr:MAG: hypothetical protein EON65_43085 [archaeon]
MKIISFNINGLRSVLGTDNNLDKFLLSLPEADIICVQETKINHSSYLTASLALLHHFHSYYSFHHDEYLFNKRLSSIGYAGVATFYRKQYITPIGFEEGFTTIFNPPSSLPPESVQHPFNITTDSTLLKSIDAESRCVLTYHENWVMVNTYCPNNADAADRQQYRRLFYGMLWKRLVSFLDQGLSVVWAGDINISYHPTDHCDYALEYGKLCQKHGYDVVEQKIREYIENFVESSDEIGEDDEFAPTTANNTQPGTQPIPSTSKSRYNLSLLSEFVTAFYAHNYHRRWLYRLLHLDEVAAKYHFRDSFRSLHPHAVHAYTCWNTLTNARQGNYGSRIDMIFVAGKLFDPSTSNLQESGMLSNIGGSDHCPIFVDIDIPTHSMGNYAVKAVVPWNLKHLNGQQRLADAFQKQQVLPRVIRDVDESSGRKDVNDAKLAGDSGKVNGSNSKPSKKQRISDFFGQSSSQKVSSGLTGDVIDMTQDDGGSNVFVMAASAEKVQTDNSAEGAKQVAVDECISSTDDKDLMGCQETLLEHPADEQTNTNSEVTSSVHSARSVVQQTPLCKKHREPCTIFTVNKKGPNRGRKFYLCSRPIGNAKDLHARCDHFEWYIPTKESSSLHAFLKK